MATLKQTRRTAYECSFCDWRGNLLGALDAHIGQWHVKRSYVSPTARAEVCSVCSEPVLADGLCRRHYDRRRRTGSPLLSWQEGLRG